jgi:hypothetical protein
VTLDVRPCRECGLPIAFARAGERWRRIDPASAAEHVVDARGSIVYDERLGHRSHVCERPTGVRAELVAAVRHISRFEEVAAQLRRQVEDAPADAGLGTIFGRARQLIGIVVDVRGRVEMALQRLAEGER